MRKYKELKTFQKGNLKIILCQQYPLSIYPDSWFIWIEQNQVYEELPTRPRVITEALFNSITKSKQLINAYQNWLHL